MTIRKSPSRTWVACWPRRRRRNRRYWTCARRKSSQQAQFRAQNIPIDELRERLDEIARSRKIIAFCQVGMRGYLATRILRQKGFDAVNLSGGYKTYELYAGVGLLPAALTNTALAAARDEQCGEAEFRGPLRCCGCAGRLPHRPDRLRLNSTSKQIHS